MAMGGQFQMLFGGVKSLATDTCSVFPKSTMKTEAMLPSMDFTHTLESDKMMLLWIFI